MSNEKKDEIEVRRVPPSDMMNRFEWDMWAVSKNNTVLAWCYDQETAIALKVGLKVMS